MKRLYGEMERPRAGRRERDDRRWNYRRSESRDQTKSKQRDGTQKRASSALGRVKTYLYYPMQALFFWIRRGPRAPGSHHYFRAFGRYFRNETGGRVLSPRQMLLRQHVLPLLCGVVILGKSDGLNAGLLGPGNTGGIPRALVGGFPRQGCDEQKPARPTLPDPRPSKGNRARSYAGCRARRAAWQTRRSDAG